MSQDTTSFRQGRPFAGWRKAAASTLAAAGVLLALAVSPAQAVLGLAMTHSLDFGRLSKPSSGTQEFTLDELTGTVTEGAGDGKYLDGAQRGEVAVSGDADTAVTVAVSIGSFGLSGIAVLAVTVEGTANQKQLTLDGAGHASVRFGGTISVSGQTSPQSSSAAVVVTATYD
ncbi:MAG: DUF4402 domain-containing protein [Myxococcota bacterium]